MDSRGSNARIHERASCADLLDAASRLATLTRLDDASLSPAYWTLLRQSAAEALTNRCSALCPKDLIFQAFSLSPARPQLPLVTDNDEPPYLVIEEKTCFVDTNVYWLQLWLTVERGVDQREDGSFDPDGLLAWRTARRLLDDLRTGNL